MNFSNGVAALLTLLGISLFDGAAASLNCSFGTSLCDWKQTTKQCSWTSNPRCVGKTGCIFITRYSGKGCLTADLTATIGNRRSRGIYFEYLMFSSGVTLKVKDGQGRILWSCSRSMGRGWRTEHILLQKHRFPKAVTIEVSFAPESQGLVAVKTVLEAEKINASTSCYPDRKHAAYAASKSKLSLSTKQDFSPSPTKSSSRTTILKRTKSPKDVPKTVAPVTKRQPKKNRLIHAQAVKNQSTRTHPTIQTKKIKVVKSHTPAAKAVKVPTSHAAKVPPPVAAKKSTSRGVKVPTTHAVKIPSLHPVKIPSPHPVKIPTSKAVKSPTSHAVKVPTPPAVKIPTSHAVKIPISKAVKSPTSHAIKVPTPPAVKIPSSHAVKIPTSKAVKSPTSHAVKVPTPPAVKIPSSHPVKIPTSKAVKSPTSHAVKMPTPPAVKIPSSHPVKIPTSKAVKSPTSHAVKVPTPPAPIVKTKPQTVTTTTEASKTTSHQEKETSSHVNQFTKTHSTTSERTNSIASNRPRSEKPVHTFRQLRSKISSVSHTSLIIGAICAAFLLTILTVFTVRQIRKGSSDKHMYTLLHMTREIKA